MTSDIISIPWQCGDKDCADCAQQWHMSHYTLDEQDGSVLTSSPYGDGDWEPDDGPLPTFEEEVEANREYLRFVADTGEDPLGEIAVRSTRRVRQRWQVRFRQSVAGAVLVGARRRRGQQWTQEVPGHVAQFLDLEHVGGLLRAREKKFNDYASTVEGCEDCKVQRDRPGFLKFTVTVEHDLPRPADAVRRERIRIARGGAA